MKTFSLTVTVFALTLPAVNAGNGLAREDGVRLLQACSAAQQLIAGSLTDETLRADAALCMGFLEGFAFGHGWKAWRLKQDMYFCPPEGFDYTDAVPAVVRYLQAHPERHIQRAHLLVFAALSRAFPCTP